MDFKWDDQKGIRKLDKHGVSFQEAATVFGDPLAVTFEDPDHSIGEHRYLTFGLTGTGKLIIVSHTNGDTKIRIISVRIMTKTEKKIYEKY